MGNSTWTCGALKNAYAAVNEGSNGAPGEARNCALARHWALSQCECDGVPAPDSGYRDPNAACDLCASAALNYVPSARHDDTVATGVIGQMNCDGLYYALAEGVATEDVCSDLQINAGPFCCSLPPTSGTATCRGVHEECENDDACCGEFKCRVVSLIDNTRKVCRQGHRDRDTSIQ